MKRPKTTEHLNTPVLFCDVAANCSAGGQMYAGPKGGVLDTQGCMVTGNFLSHKGKHYVILSH